MQEITIKGKFTIKTDDPNINMTLKQTKQPLTYLKFHVELFQPHLKIEELSAEVKK